MPGTKVSGPVYYYSSTPTKIPRITGCVKNTAVQSLSSPATALGSGPRLSSSSGSPRRPDCLIRGSSLPISLPFAILVHFLADTRHCGRGHLFTRHRDTARVAVQMGTPYRSQAVHAARVSLCCYSRFTIDMPSYTCVEGIAAVKRE